MQQSSPSNSNEHRSDLQIRHIKAGEHNGIVEQIRDALRYHYLIRLFIRRDFVAVYKQSILGPLWHVLSPVFTTLVFTVIFGIAAKLPTEGCPPLLFYLCGVVFWSFFSGSFRQTARFFIDNKEIFKKVYFPRLVIPISIVGSQLLSFAIQFCLFLCVWIYYYSTGAVKPHVMLAMVPFYMLLMALLAMGTGLLFAALTVRYRDFAFVLEFFTQIWMYATPIIYPITMLPGRWKSIAELNPMASLMEGIRSAFGLSGATVEMYWAAGALACILIFLIGLKAFSRIERNFVDIV